MRVIFFSAVLFSVFTLFSCGSAEEKTDGEQKEYLMDDAPAMDSTEVNAVVISDSLRKNLRNYFSEEVISKMNLFIGNFNNAYSDTLFEINYNEGILLLKDLKAAFENPQTEYLKQILVNAEDDIFPLYQELEQFNGQLGPLYFTCVAECTELDFCFDLKVMKQKSKLTNGEADDAFFDLLFFVEGDFGYAGYFDFKVWDILYLDYGGSNRLGDGTILDVVNRLIQFKLKYELFESQISLIHDDVFAAISGTHAYEYSLEEVLAEYNKIFKLNYFSGDELNAIRSTFDKIKNHPEECQFDCENGNCKFG